MRARYYSPELRRFINADILMGDINNSTTLNRYAYANGNPISNIDPFGLAADEGRGGSNKDWYGAAAYKKISVTTINEEFDLTLDLGLIKVFHTQTVTTTKTYGKTGEWFGAYAYTDINVDGYDSNAGIGVDLLYVLGFDINVKALGIGATLSLNIDNYSAYANVEVDLFGDSTASVGMINKLSNGVEVNDQYGIKGDTWFVLCTVATLLGSEQLDYNAAPNRAPANAY